jgi:hypothetical protein
MKLSFALGALAATCLLFAGCSTSGYKKAADTSVSLHATAQEIDNSLPAMDAVIASLSDLMDKPGASLALQFQAYSTAVDKLESAEKSVGNHASAMDSQGKAYFKNWDAELAKIQNDALQTRSLNRRNVMSARFEKAKASYAAATAECSPLMSNLKDVRTALATDLTANGLKSAKSLASQASKGLPKLRATYASLSAEFKDLGTALSAGTAE